MGFPLEDRLALGSVAVAQRVDTRGPPAEMSAIPISTSPIPCELGTLPIRSRARRGSR